jgi:cytochrome c556
MRRAFIIGTCACALAAAITLTLQAASSRPAAKDGPRLVPVAETKLLMEGLAQANFRGLERLLKEKPADVEAWTFARGQALLIAETGNLLMLRPPRNPAEKIWMDRAGALRGTATNLARLLASRDYEKSRQTLALLANTCNACHQSFKVKTRIVPFAETKKAEE